QQRLIGQAESGRGAADLNEMRDTRQLNLDVLRAIGEAFLVEHRLCAHRAHQLYNLRSSQSVVQRNTDDATLGKREVDLRNLDAVAAQERGHVALDQPELHQAVRQPVAALVGFFKGQGAAGCAAEE